MWITIQEMVNLCDTDGDGQINSTDFKSWYTAINVDSGLSVDELVKSVWDYYHGTPGFSLLARS